MNLPMFKYIQIEVYFRKGRARGDYGMVSARRVTGKNRGRIFRLGSLRLAIRWERTPT